MRAISLLPARARSGQIERASWDRIRPAASRKRPGWRIHGSSGDAVLISCCRDGVGRIACVLAFVSCSNKLLQGRNLARPQAVHRH